MPKTEAIFRQYHLLRNFGEQLVNAVLHFFAMNPRVVQQESQCLESFFKINQSGKNNDLNGIFGLAGLFKCNVRIATQDINGQKTIQFLT